MLAWITVTTHRSTKASAPKKPSRWSHPLAVGVAVALVGVVGTVAAALISSSGTDSPPPDSRTTVYQVSPRESMPSGARSEITGAEPRVRIDTVTYIDAIEGTDLIVRGNAAGVHAGNAIYAVARAPADGSSAARKSNEQQSWSVSDAVTPNADRQWEASIHIDDATNPVTVFAVEMSTRLVTPPRCDTCRVPPYVDLTKSRLETAGPVAAPVRTRTPLFTIGP